MLPIPPLSAVRAFEAASRHENFSRAAEELAMTQAGVSYQMKLLEERLGAPLFVRKGRGMVLTELGRRIAPRVTDAFTALGEAFAIARSESESVLAITAPRTLATNWLASRLGEFHIVHPDLAVRLDVTDRMVDLASSEFDIGIRGMPAPSPGLVSHFLMRMPVTPLASPAFLARHPLKTPADLRSTDRLSPDDDWWALWFDSLAVGNLEGVARIGIRFESQVLDGHAAIAGHGIAILSPPMFQSAIEAGLLVQPFPHVATYGNAFWLVYPEHKRNMAKVRAFRDWLIDAVKRAAGDDPYGILAPLPGAQGVDP
jgi:LysR family glycine cleavage system transcriptional activator